MKRRETRQSRNLLKRQEKKARRKSLLSKAVLAGTAATFAVGAGIAPASADQQRTQNHQSSSQEGAALENRSIFGEQVIPEILEASLVSTASSESSSSDEGEDDITSEEVEERVEREYESYVLVSSGDQVKTLTIRNAGEKVFTALKDRGVSTSTLRTDEGDLVSSSELKDMVLNNGETLVLTTSERKIDTEEVDLDYRTERVETDDLLEGVQEIEQEGINGSGVKITTTYTNGDAASSESRLAITEAPQREIVLVGTGSPEEDEEATALIEGLDVDGNERGNGDGSFYEDVDLSATIYSPGSDEYSEEAADALNATADNSSIDPSEVNNDVVKTMLGQVGNRYVWGGTTPEGGFDCSGIIQWAYAQNGKSIPRLAIDQGRAGTPVSWDDIQVGDFIYNSGHIGVYAGNGKIVQASNPRTGVNIADANYFRNAGLSVSRIE